MHSPGLSDVERQQWSAIAGLEKSHAQVATILESVATRLESIEVKVSDAAKPQWQALSFMLGVVVFIYGIIAFGINSKIDSVLENATRTSVTLHDHMDGHPERIEAKIEANAAAIDKQLEAQRREQDSLEKRVIHEIDRARDRLERIERSIYGSINPDGPR